MFLGDSEKTTLPLEKLRKNTQFPPPFWASKRRSMTEMDAISTSFAKPLVKLTNEMMDLLAPQNAP